MQVALKGPLAQAEAAHSGRVAGSGTGANDTVVQLRASRAPLSALSGVSAAGPVILASLLLYMMAVLFKELVPPMLVFAIVGLAAAGAILAGWRWAPALASVYALLLGALLVAPAAGEIAHALGQPSDGMYPLLVIFFPVMATAIVAGIAATVQNYRQGAFDRRAPRWLAPGVATMAGIAAGALMIGVFPRPSAADSVSAEVLSSLPAVRAQTFQFQQTELRVKAGETVAFRLENGDAAGHYFDIDELGVHAPIPAGQNSFALFKPSQPGTYIFYCSPHFDKATGQGMKGTIVVE